MRKKRFVYFFFCNLIALCAIALFGSTVFAHGTQSQNQNTLSAKLLASTWSQSEISDDIAYFLFLSPAKIERYDLESEAWLTPISLTHIADAPTAFTVDEAGIFIGFGRYVSRFNLDGSGQTHMHNTSENIRGLSVISNSLIINAATYSDRNLISVNKNTGAFIATSTNYFYRYSGLSVAPSIGKLFGRSIGVSPSDIHQIRVNADGTFGTASDSPYHGDYPGASKTFVFPDDSRVVDSSGTVYNTSDLTYSNSFAGAVDDISFYGNLPIVLRDGTLIAYSNTLLESGRFTPEDHEPDNIYFKDGFIHTFYHEENRGVASKKIDISLLTTETPGEPVDPNGLLYTPDKVILGNGEVVYILSKSHLSIFRWSVSQQQYLETIPLVNAPKFMAYSGVTNRLYLAYASGVITQISPDISPNESPLVNSPQTPCGLATAGQYIFVCDPSGAWVSHFTYDPDGSLISQVDWNYRSDEYIWSAANNKMYFFRDDSSPNDLLWEDINADGEIGTKTDSPYHSSSGIDHPIRVAPDGSKVLLGSGRIYDPITLSQVDTLSNNISDAAWLNNTLFSTRDIGVDTQVQQWGISYTLESTLEIPGNPIRILPISQGLLVIQDFYGLPHFTILNSSLETVFRSPTLSGISTTSNSPVDFGKTTFFSAELDWGVGPVSYLWDFGDGSFGSSSATSHVYPDIGDYTVVLTVSNPLETLTDSFQVSIVEVPIEGLNVTNNGPVEVGDSVSLQSSLSAGSFVNYVWDLGDGSTTNGSSVSHTYAEIGTYTATLTASNSVSSMTATTTVEVTEVFTPVMKIQPTNLVFTMYKGGVVEPQTFTIENVGTGSFNWTLSGIPSWLSVDKLAGENSETITVSVNAPTKSVGTYSTNLKITSFEAENGIEILPITLNIISSPEIQLASNIINESVYLEWDVLNSSETLTYQIYRRNNTTNKFELIGTTANRDYVDQTDVERHIEYCYRIDGISSSTNLTIQSNTSCVSVEDTTLWIPNTSAKKGQIAIVPVNIKYSDGLKIAASDIWLEYDSLILNPVGVSATPLTDGYIWSYAVENTNFGNIKRIRIGAFSNQSPQLYGEGSLFWLAFEVLGNPNENSKLDLKEFISGIGGSTIYASDDLLNPIDLQLIDGQLLVANGFGLGDLNGNGIVETVDALIAMQIAIGKIQPSQKQIQAGDITGNGKIDIGDATMIFYYAIHQEWPTVPENPTRSLRMADAPINLSLDEVEGRPGTEVKINMYIDNVVDLSGAQLRLAYDTNIIEEITDVNLSSATSNFILDFNDDNESGTVQIGMMSLVPYKGSGAIISLTVKIKDGAVNGSSSAVMIDDLSLTDVFGRDFATSAIQAEITKEAGNVSVEAGAPEIDSHTIFLPLLNRP